MAWPRAGPCGVRLGGLAALAPDLPRAMGEDRTGHACIGVVDTDGSQLDRISLEQCLKQRTVKPFAALADLAAAFAMPQNHFEMTVNQYNRAVAEGNPDPFGKPLGQNARPLAKSPFFAIRLWPKIHYTPGGIAINPKAQVLDLERRPIRGLFAAGEVTGGIHGASRLGSCALADCLVFGRIAGRQAAARTAGNS